jgi:hypothetical protein
MHDVAPQLYKTVIREMIRHENDLTNHRIMWLLIVQGLIANAAVTAGRESGPNTSAFATVGILVTLSAFIILYKSYQARGYLQFLGNEAKQGPCGNKTCPWLAGQASGSKVGGRKFGLAPGSGKPASCWNHSSSCPPSSCSPGWLSCCGNGLPSMQDYWSS